jgi:hypothetical protein
VKLRNKKFSVQTTALIDSGAYSCFIGKRCFANSGFLAIPLPGGRRIRAFNADGTENCAGAITHFCRVQLRIGQHKTTQSFLITDLGAKDIIIGYSFLRQHNPVFDFQLETMEFSRCPPSCKYEQPRMNIDEEDLDGLQLPHLEDVAQDSFAQLNHDEWDHDEHFIHWIEHSDNPVARFLLAHTVLEEEIGTVSAGKDDKAYWSPHVPKHYHQHGKVFSKLASERMPTRKAYDHAIELNPGATLPRPSKLYPLNPAERTSLDEWIKDELAKGYIRPSKSPTAAPVFFVKKKDGSLCLVQDYRALNAVTKKNKFPIPRISDLVDRLSASSIFTSMDLRWGFNNVRIWEGDEEKAAFIMPKGLFEPTVMYFGFCNAPSTFQQMMNEVLHEEIATGHVVVYIDDILIFTDDLILHRQLVHRVLEKLAKNDLFIKPEKCRFEQSEVEFLGLIVGKNSIKMNPSKVEGITKWPAPTKVKHIQAFLGLCRGSTRNTQPNTTLRRTCEHVKVAVSNGDEVIRGPESLGRSNTSIDE